jgi:hypothetical protein
MLVVFARNLSLSTNSSQAAVIDLDPLPMNGDDRVSSVLTIKSVFGTGTLVSVQTAMSVGRAVDPVQSARALSAFWAERYKRAHSSRPTTLAPDVSDEGPIELALGSGGAASRVDETDEVDGGACDCLP